MTAPLPTPGQIRRFKLRRDWAEEWERVNPILEDGEPGYDKTRNMLKIGDGETPWSDLRYLTPPEADVVLTGDTAIDSVMLSHVNSPTPHPAYDDGPSFLLLYQNAKV